MKKLGINYKILAIILVVINIFITPVFVSSEILTLDEFSFSKGTNVMDMSNKTCLNMNCCKDSIKDKCEMNCETKTAKKHVKFDVIIVDDLRPTFKKFIFENIIYHYIFLNVNGNENSKIKGIPFPNIIQNIKSVVILC